MVAASCGGLCGEVFLLWLLVSDVGFWFPILSSALAGFRKSQLLRIAGSDFRFLVRLRIPIVDCIEGCVFPIRQ